MSTRIFRGRVLDTPRSPFHGGELRSDEDVSFVVTNGVISYRGTAAGATALAPDAPVTRITDGFLIPGMVDTHVHYPQVRAIGGLGRPLLDWLQGTALPEEARLADVDYASAVAGEFLTGLAASGTTTALVFGSHYASAMHAFFGAAHETGLRITTGLVVGDRLLRDDLHTDPTRAVREASELISAWHGTGRLRYAVTPRFSLATSEHLLAACAETFRGRADLWFTTHLNENLTEVATVAGLFPAARDYLDTYERHGLIGPRSVLAHNVHPTDSELTRMAGLGSSIAHCPTSNSALGSGLFPLKRHLDAGVRVALGSDVGAGTGFGLLKEGLQAYFMQQLRAEDGVALSPAHLLHLATRAGAEALGLHTVGYLDVGMEFDAVHVRPAEGSTFEVVLRHAASPDEALARTFALGTVADIACSWVGGREPVATTVQSRAVATAS